MKAALCLALLLALAGCARITIDAAEWQRMSHEDRVIYVHSLIGAERAKDAKGGGGRRYPLSPEAYVRSIDEAYAQGDQREVEAVFAGLE